MLNKRVQSAVKFSDCDWSSPVKDIHDHSDTNLFSTQHATNSNKIVYEKKEFNRQQFANSLKYKKYQQNISELINRESPGRKKSVQSYHKIEKRTIEEYALENPSKWYKSNRHNFYKRESQSNSSSRSKLVPWKTPNAGQNQAYINSYASKTSNTTVKSQHREASHNPGQKQGKTSMLIDFCSLYINKDQICLNGKYKYNKDNGEWVHVWLFLQLRSRTFQRLTTARTCMLKRQVWVTIGIS